MIPTVDKSCCTLSLRTGSIVIAVAYAILIILCAGLYSQGYLDESEDKDTDKDGGRIARTGYSLLVDALMLVVCVIVLVGVFMRKSILLLIGAIAFFIYAAIAIVYGLSFIDEGKLAELIVSVLLALLILYCGVVLWSHGKELE